MHNDEKKLLSKSLRGGRRRTASYAANRFPLSAGHFGGFFFFMSGWIKLHRSFLEFDWYDDPNVVRLLIHLILTCNYEQKQWRGIEIKAGQIVTSYDKLADALSLSSKQIRIAMDKLEKGREITRERAGKGQLVTLVKWGKFQGEEENEGRKRADNKAERGQEEGRKRATTKERKESKEVKKEELSASAPPHPLVEWLNSECPDVQKLRDPLTNEQAEKIVAKYPNNPLVKKVFMNMQNWKPLRKNCNSAYLTFLKWSAKDFNSDSSQMGSVPNKKRL